MTEAKLQPQYRITSNGKRIRVFSEAEWFAASRMAKAHCSLTEIAAALSTHKDTLKAACIREHEILLDQWFESQKLRGRTELKLVRFDLATKSRSWRAIEHLSRVWFGENPKQTIKVDKTENVRVYMPANGRETQERKALTAEPVEADYRVIEAETPIQH